MKKQPFLKGKLTKLSAAFFAIVQIPNLLSDLSESAETFAQASQAPTTVLSLAAAAGVIWGGLRRAFNYFGA